MTAERLETVFSLARETQGAWGSRPPDRRGRAQPTPERAGSSATRSSECSSPPSRRAGQGLGPQRPWPPDTIFARAYRGQFDAVVAMYHDQGHIPIKMIGFDEGVNVSPGLPIVRTSVDHGTAFDIAGQGVARPVSMIQSTVLAARLAQEGVLESG